MTAFVWRCMKDAIILAGGGNTKGPQAWIGFFVYAGYFLFCCRECYIKKVSSPWPIFLRNALILLSAVFAFSVVFDLLKGLILLLIKCFR